MKALLCSLLMVLLVLGPAAPASADSTGGDISVAQTLGDRDLTLVLRRVTAVPGPLRVDVITHAGSPAGTLTVALGPGSQGQVHLGPAPGPYGVTLHVARAGSWELAVSDGVRTARVPFVVARPAISPAERAVYGGFVAAGVLLLVSLVVAVRARRRLWALVPATGVVAGLAVAVTGALLSASMLLPAPPLSRPPVSLSVHGDALYLTDATTGLPVDDLVVHDGALMHLLAVGPGGQLRHVHPIRTAPGVFSVSAAFPWAGHYAIAAELMRQGGGAQMIRSATGLDVADGSPTAPATPLRVTSGRRATTTVSGVPVSVAAIGTSAITLIATIGETPTLQPWLGMLGHLIVVGPLPAGDDAQSAPVWAHAHSMGDLTSMGGMHGGAMPEMAGLMPVNGDSAADETVAAYGPSLSFTYTFSQPGRYRLWIQAERDYRILTVPLILDVSAPT
jgi:hypothetical protein